MISDFYDYGELIEYFGKRNKDFFWVNTEERAKITQHFLAQIIDKAYDMLPQNRNTFITEKRDFFSFSFDNFITLYTPKKNDDVIKDYLNKVNKITTSSCGLKLKKLAKLS